MASRSGTSTPLGTNLKPVDVTASEATLFLPTPLHPNSEAYAETLFKRVVREGVDGWTRERCLAESDAALVRIGEYPAADVAASPHLKIIARNGTGYDAIDLPACREHGVVVTNMPGGNARDVAELAIALALTVLRRVVEINNRIRSGVRTPSIQALSATLLDRTVGLVGMGDIAYAAANMFRAFGCSIIVYSPTSPSDRWVTPSDAYPTPVPHTRVDSLDALLAAADVVSLHCPLTPSTANMISTDQLRRMKSSAVLINTARGAMVDEEALAAALKDGIIAGAGLDVMRTEPAFGDNLGQLRDLPNVVILPHLGSSTHDAAERGCSAAIDIVVEYLSGKGARNRVA